MLVSHKYKFIYLKPGKTAGTSVEVFLEPLCAPPGHVPKHISPAFETEYGIIGERASDPDRSGFYNHMRPHEVKAKLPEDVWNGYVKVATVRNPFDRAVSAFHHFGLNRAGTEGMTEDEVVTKFREWVASSALNSFTISSFAEAEGEPCLDFLIHYESLEDDITAFLKRIGVLRSALGEMPRLKTQIRKGGIPLTRYYDEATRARICEGAQKDFDLFGYSTEVAAAEQARHKAPQAAAGSVLGLNIFRELAVASGKRTPGGDWMSESPADVQKILTRAFQIVERARSSDKSE